MADTKDSHENKALGAPEHKGDESDEGKDTEEDDGERELVGVERTELGEFVVPVVVSEEFYAELTSPQGLRVAPITNVKLRAFNNRGNTIVWSSGE